MQRPAPTASWTPCSRGTHRGRGNCKKPCSVGYTPSSNVSLNHWHIYNVCHLWRGTLESFHQFLTASGNAQELQSPTSTVWWNGTFAKNQPAASDSETTMPRILQLQQGPGDVPLESETPRVFTGDLGTGGQVPACKWTVVMLQYANNSHRKEPKLHSIARLNITLAV